MCCVMRVVVVVVAVAVGALVAPVGFDAEIRFLGDFVSYKGEGSSNNGSVLQISFVMM